MIMRVAGVYGSRARSAAGAAASHTEVHATPSRARALSEPDNAMAPAPIRREWLPSISAVLLTPVNSLFSPAAPPMRNSRCT